jgi:hypothetical protein
MLDDFRTLTGMSGKFGNISRCVVTKNMYAYIMPNHFKLFQKQCDIAGLLQLHWMVVINIQSHIWTIDYALF